MQPSARYPEWRGIVSMFVPSLTGGAAPRSRMPRKPRRMAVVGPLPARGTRGSAVGKKTVSRARFYGGTIRAAHGEPGKPQGHGQTSSGTMCQARRARPGGSDQVSRRSCPWRPSRRSQRGPGQRVQQVVDFRGEHGEQDCILSCSPVPRRPPPWGTPN